MMQFHELKTWPSMFEAAWGGVKTAEIRKDDRGFLVGDYLILREYIPYPDNLLGEYTGRIIVATITHVVKGAPFLPDDTAMLSIRIVERRFL